MAEKHISYKVNGDTYNIPESLSSGFEKKYPTATIEMHVGEDIYDIPLEHKAGFLNKFSNAVYSFGDSGEPEKSASLNEEVKFEIPEYVDAETPKKKLSFWDSIAANPAQSALAIQNTNSQNEKPSVDTDIANLVIDSHIKNQSKISDYMSKSEREFASKKTSEPKKKLSFWESIAANPNQSALSIVENEMGQDYADAKIAFNISNKTEDKVNQYLDPASNFFEGVAEGVGDTVFDIDTWDSTVGLEQAQRVYAITKKLDNGEKLTSGEELIIDALVDDLASDMYLAAGFGRGYKAGKVTGESLPFMVETMLNPASGTGKAITNKFGKTIFKKVAKKLGTTAGKAAITGARVAGDVAGAMTMAATTSQPRVMADALDRLSGEVDFTISEDGDFVFNGFTGGEDSMFKAYGKAFGSNTIEHFSEMVGEYFAPIGKVVGGWTKGAVVKMVDKYGFTKIKSLLTEMTPNGFGSLLNDFMEKTQWHGVIGEFNEEMISGAMNALIVGDQSLKKYDENGNENQSYLFDKDNLIDTFLGVSILGGVMSAAKTVGYTTPDTKHNREVSRAKKNLEGRFSDADMRVIEAFAENPFGADYANLEQYFGKNRSKEDKVALAEYMKAVMEKQGYEISRNASLSGTQQGMEEMQKAFKFGQSMSEADLYDVTEAESQAFSRLMNTGYSDVIGVSSYDLFRWSQDANLSEEQQIALHDLAIIRNAREGLENKLNASARAVVAANNKIASSASYNGVITVGTYNGKNVYIKGGVKVANGSVVKPSDVSGYPVQIVDQMTGETTTVESGEVSKVYRMDVAEYNSQMGDIITNAFQQRWDTWRNKKSTKSKLAEVEGLVGQSIFIDTGNGIAEVDIKQILPNGEVLIHGKKGDLGGQSDVRVDVDSFYDSMSRDSNGVVIYDQSKFRSQTKNIEEARQRLYGQEVTNTPQPVVSSEPQDFRDYTGTIVINGVPVNVTEVTQQDDTADKVDYIYIDDNGQAKAGSTTVAGFGAAVKEGEAYAKNEAPVEGATTTEPAPVENTPTPQPEPEPTPQTIDWDGLLEKDSETYFKEIQNRFGDKAAKRIGAVVAVKQKEIDALNKVKTNNTEEIFEIEDKKDALQQQIDILNEMIERLNAVPTETTAETVAETPAATEVAPTEPVSETPTEEPAPVEEVTPEPEPEPQPVADVQPAPVPVVVVDDPLTAAKDIEDRLDEQVNRTDLPHVQKQDLAYSAGKHVADLFATYEEYEAYAEDATNFGKYNDDFNRGVNDSFANRPKNVSTSPVNVVPLETEPKDTNNGETEGASTTEPLGGRPYNGNVQGTSIEGGQGEDIIAQTKQKPKSKSSKTKVAKQEEKYPARKGNATQKILAETFGFESVTIPNKNKEILNSIYDYMMEMSKMLGISPKTIGQGGWLGVKNLRGNATANARHNTALDPVSWKVTGSTLEFKYAKLRAIAHEWWHSLDRALVYTSNDGNAVDSAGNDMGTATEIKDANFEGRKEVLEAMRGVIDAIVKSGHADRLRSHPKTRNRLSYWLRPTEMAARAFDEYILGKFEEAGITVEGLDTTRDGVSEPTPEEMKVIAPAFDNLFKVLKVKEGKKEGSLLLYHIGQEVDEIEESEQISEEARQLAVEAVLSVLKDAGIDVEFVTDEQIDKMLESSGFVELMGTRVNNRRNVIAQFFSGKQLSPTEQSIVNAFAYGAKNESINVTRNGANKRIILKQGREQNAGVSHSILKHYDTTHNNYTDAELLLIPYIIQNGTETQKGNKISYSLSSNGITYVVTTEINNRQEHFSNYYTNRRPTTGNLSNTVQQHGHPLQSASPTNVSNNSITTNSGQNNNSLLQTPDGIVYGWTDGKKIFLTSAGVNPNTPIHEYTHLWAKAMMQKNPNGWNSIKQLLKNTPIWNSVINDPNYSSIHNDEDAIASEALSRMSGSANAAKMQQMAQEMIDNANGTARKLEARGLIQNMKDALNKFWNWVGTELFGIEKFESIEQITDRVLFDLLNNTDLGTLSEGQVQTQIVTDPEVIASLEASPKVTGFRNVVQNEDGTFSSPMAYWLQSTKEGAKSRVETAKFELGKWEEAEEHPELVDENGKVTLVKPNKKTVDNVAYDPYIHNRLEPVNLQFKDAWKRDDLVYVETEVAENDLNDGYHADKALLPVGVHSWSNGDVMLSRYDKPVRIMPWNEVADAWAARLNGKGVEFDVVPPAMRHLLVDRGVEILPPHKGMGKDCNDAYAAWKKEIALAESAEPFQSDTLSGDVANDSNVAPTVVTQKISKADTKVVNVTKKAKKNIQLLNNKDLKHKKIKTYGDIIQELGKYLGMEYKGQGVYATYYTPKGTLTLRFNNHNAQGDNFKKDNADQNISIYVDLHHVEPSKSSIPYVEFVYTKDDFNAHSEEIFTDVMQSLGIALDTGDFPQVLKYAKRIPHNTKEDSESTQSGAKSTSNGESQDIIVRQEGNNTKFVEQLEFKKNNERGQLEYSDEFRRLQAESARMSEQLVSEKDGVQQAAIRGLVGRIGGTLQRELERATSGRGYKLRNVVNESKGTSFDIIENVDGRLFHDIFEVVRAYLPNGELVDLHDNYDNAICYITSDGLAGFAVADDGNLISVYSLYGAQKKGFLGAIKDLITEAGATHLDGYNSKLQPLAEIYSKVFGWKVASMMDYNMEYDHDNIAKNHDMPQVAFMVNTDADVETKHFDKDQYDEAVAYQLEQIKDDNQINISEESVDLASYVARETAAQIYDKEVNKDWQEFQRQFQDAFQPVRIAIEAIQRETGNIPIEDWENYLLVQNQSSSRSRVEIDNFKKKYYEPIISQVQSVIDKIMESRGLDITDKNKRSEVYNEVVMYLIAKHGLERNEYYQTHKMRKLRRDEIERENKKAQDAYDAEVEAINADVNLSDVERELQLKKAEEALNAALIEIKTREVPDVRDYAGLTSLFGFKPKEFKKAEEEAQKFVDMFEESLGRTVDTTTGEVSQSPEIDGLWKKINAATDKTLRHSYESGLLSRQQYNDIKSMFKFYIPLRGFDETTAEDVYSYARFEGSRFNPAVQTAKGRTSVADDPIAIIMNMAESEIAQGNKNRAKQALYNFLLNRAGANNQQNSLMQIEEVWYLRNVDESGEETITIAAPNHEAGETYEEFEAIMQELAAEDKAFKSKKGNKLDIGLRFQKQMNRNAHYVYLKVNGVEKAIYINGDPKAANAINGTGTAPLGEGAKKFRDFQRFISSMFTNYSLEFTARNYFRDMIYSHINIDVRESDPAYRKKFRQNWRHNNMRTMMKMLKAYRAGEYDSRPLTETEAAFVEFMNNGGQTGYTLINSVENHKKDLENAIQRMRNGIDKGGIKDSSVFKATLGGIELLNDASELVTRFAAFKTSRDMGRSVTKSISDAKEITVNFNTRGAQDAGSKNWMGTVASYFGWSKYFFNASVQGVQNIKGMADANKLKFCSTVGGVMATGFLMPVFISAITELLGGDDEEEYWNIPEYERQNNFCIPLGGGKYAKIPLPIGFREVYALGDMVAAMLMDKKFTRDFGQVGMDMANKISSVVLPINPLESAANGLNIWQTFLYTALPSSAQFAIQNATNVDWKGAPLQKEYTYNENDPKWMKAFASNPDWLTGLSKWCNEHINLDGDFKGMDWSPEKVDNILSNMLGGVYSLIKKSGKTVSMIWNEENRNLSNIPLSGVVLGSGIDSDDRFITDAYYDMQGYYDGNINYIKRRAEKFGYTIDDVFEKEKGKHHPKMLEIYQNSNFDFMQEWYLGNQELNELNKEIKKLKKKIAEKKNPSSSLLNKLANKKNKFDAERRDFVNDMLELD